MSINGEFVRFLIETNSIQVPEEALWAEYERRRQEKKKQQNRLYNQKYYKKNAETICEKRKNQRKASKTDAERS